MSQYSYHISEKDPSIMMNVWRKNGNTNLTLEENRNLFLAFLNNKEMVRNLNPEMKKQFRETVIPLLLNAYANVQHQAWKADMKKLFIFYISENILDIHTLFDKNNDKYTMDSGSMVIGEFLNLDKNDISEVLLARKENLTNKLEEKNNFDYKKIKI